MFDVNAIVVDDDDDLNASALLRLKFVGGTGDVLALWSPRTFRSLFSSLMIMMTIMFRK